MGQSDTTNRILVVDDDERFLPRLVQALKDRGYEAHGAVTAQDALALAERVEPGRIVLDLRIGGASGLDLIPQLIERLPGVAIVLLTGYGSISAATEAIRRGAIEVLTKPADTDEILTRFEAGSEERDGEPSIEEAEIGQVPSLAQVEWEHIQRVLADCDGNISAAARKLGIHRRTLQRKLHMRPEN